MNKKLYSLIVFVFIFNLADAQISIVSVDLTAVGDQITRYTDTVPTYGPGSAGANQIWDFSGAVIEETTSTDVVTVGSTAFNATFLNSTYAMTNDASSYLFFTHNAVNLILDGAAGDLLGGGEIIEAPFTDALTLHVLPRNYGDVFSDTYGFQAEADGAPFGVYRVRLTHSGTVYDTTDGYGTLITPTGTYEALRSKITTYTTNVIDAKLAVFLPWTNVSTESDTSVSYIWHAKEEKLSIAEYNYNNAGDPASFVYSAVPPVITTNIAFNSINTELNIYPQPASDQLYFSGVNHGSGYTVEIYSIEGKLLRQEPLINSSVPLNGLNNGFYVLRLLDPSAGYVVSRRFVVGR